MNTYRPNSDNASSHSTWRRSHKLYFVIFAAFLGINDLESRLEVIQGHTFLAAIESPCTTLYKVVNSNFRSIFNRFGDIAGFVRPEPIFPYPTPIAAEIWCVPFEVGP